MLYKLMLAAPREIDVSPTEVVAWSCARGIDDRDWEMPAGTMVTSRAGAGASRKSRHYALVCRRAEPLHEDDLNTVNSLGFLELEHQPFDLGTCVEEALEVLSPKAFEKGLDLGALVAAAWVMVVKPNGF